MIQKTLTFEDSFYDSLKKDHEKFNIKLGITTTISQYICLRLKKCKEIDNEDSTQ